MPGATGPCTVYPSGPEIPQTLLRIVIVFEAPVHAPLFARLRLRYDDGTAAMYALVQQELWSPDQRTLTLLLHPSRVKSGTVGHETLGRALRPGEGISLELDGRRRKRWHVVAEPWKAPSPERWVLQAVAACSAEPLCIDLVDPIDALSRDLIKVVAGQQPVPGRVSLARGERGWRFWPAEPWDAERDYRVYVHPRLENPCGDQVGEPLEHASGAGLGARRRSTVLPVAVLGA